MLSKIERSAFVKKGVQVQSLCDHGEGSSGAPRPLFSRAIPIKLESVAVWIAQIDRFADPMVGCTIDADPMREETTQGVCKVRPRRIEDRCVIKTRGAKRSGRSAETFPRVETDVVVITVGGQKRGVPVVTLSHFESEHT